MTRGGALRRINQTRDRLIVELREGQNPYVREYVYDQVGNRKEMLDVINQRRVEYVYDIDDPETWGSDNHRLLKALEYDISGTPDVLLSTTWYYYNVLGSVRRVVKNLAGTDEYESTWFEYAKNGTAVSYVLRESWTSDGVWPRTGRSISVVRSVADGLRHLPVRGQDFSPNHEGNRAKRRACGNGPVARIKRPLVNQREPLRVYPGHASFSCLSCASW